MTLILLDFLQYFVAIVTTLIIGIVTYFQWRYTYWKRRNVPYIKPKFPFGTFENPWRQKEFAGIRLQRQYQKLKSEGHRHGGLYAFCTPIYLPIDLELVKSIMSKDFQYFTDRGVYFNEKEDPVSAHLLNLEGQKWRVLRNKLSPTFTTGKLKIMIPGLLSCAEQLVSAMNDYVQSKQTVNMKLILECLTMDVIGSCIFGLECNSFKDTSNEFHKYGKMAFQLTPMERFKYLITNCNHNLSRFLGASSVPAEAANFFLNLISSSVNYRKKHNVSRKDMLQILIDLKYKDVDKEVEDDTNCFSVPEIAAQTFVFFIAGSESSSSTSALTLFELAMNPEWQERVRDEINSTLDKYNGQVTYETLSELQLLEQVVNETMRLHTSTGEFNRLCVRDYKIPGTDIILEKGTKVMVPMLALHGDPEYFPEPEKFNPERFNKENIKNIPPFTFMPFGEGPRGCIGFRMGMMMVKVGLLHLLRNFRFLPSEKSKPPLEIHPLGIISIIDGGIWLNVEKINS